MTTEQKLGVRIHLNYLLSTIFTDAYTRQAVVEQIFINVVNDIEETADWSDYAEDEINETDVEISLQRVLANCIGV